MSEYYSVSQYADITGKDPGNIRRMLIKGALPGEKIGKQWVIKKGTVYPEDKRVKSGNYRNWRRKSSVRQANPKLIKTLNRMCDDLHGVYGTSMERVVLYGSYARGEQTPESDADIALILTDDDGARHDKMTDIVVDYELEIGVTLSVITIDSNQYKAWNKVLPFYRNVDKDGIVLWRAE